MTPLLIVFAASLLLGYFVMPDAIDDCDLQWPCKYNKCYCNSDV